MLGDESGLESLRMHEVHDFGVIVLLVATAFALAVVTSRLSERLRIPGPALFLIAAALLSDVFPSLGDLSIRTVERIAVVALVVILFDGGARIGLRRFRKVAIPVLSLGVVGMFATAGLMMLAAHTLLDFSWITSGLIGAAIAPTDPAVMFSVLGRREVGGQPGRSCEAESGANDPVGIALMIGMIEFATSDDGTVWTVVREFVLEMSVGLAVGVAGAYLLLLTVRRLTASLPGAVSAAHARRRRCHLRARVGAARLRLSRRVRRRHHRRRRAHAVQGRGRVVLARRCRASPRSWCSSRSD